MSFFSSLIVYHFLFIMSKLTRNKTKIRFEIGENNKIGLLRKTNTSISLNNIHNFNNLEQFRRID